MAGSAPRIPSSQEGGLGVLGASMMPPCPTFINNDSDHEDDEGHENNELKLQYTVCNQYQYTVHIYIYICVCVMCVQYIYIYIYK